MDYTKLCNDLRALIDGVPHLWANLANTSALLYSALDRINWCGFYIMKDGRLVLGPFQGKPACIEIAVGRGVCGSAVRDRKTLRVDDVHAFDGHIACDPNSKSEIVVPLIDADGRVFGVLDIDSPIKERFDERDQAGLENFAKSLIDELSKQGIIPTDK